MKTNFLKIPKTQSTLTCNSKLIYDIGPIGSISDSIVSGFNFPFCFFSVLLALGTGCCGKREKVNKSILVSAHPPGFWSE